MEDKNKNKEQGQEITVINMADINPTKSIITLSVNGLYAPIKRQKLLEYILKNPSIYCQETVCSAQCIHTHIHIHTQRGNT